MYEPDSLEDDAQRIARALARVHHYDETALQRLIAAVEIQRSAGQIDDFVADLKVHVLVSAWRDR